MAEKLFRLLQTRSSKNEKTCPSAIPWSIIAPFEKQAKANHYQTLEQLNERGGLDVRELWMVMNNKGYHDKAEMPPHDECCDWLDGVLNLGKIRPCTVTTGSHISLEFENVEQAFIDDLEDVVDEESHHTPWFFKSDTYILIDVADLIRAAIFDDPYTQAVYDNLEKYIDNRWKSATYIKIKLPQ